ncbi:MAG: hypothetical protein ACK55Z_23725, partial [bacterium]
TGHGAPQDVQEQQHQPSCVAELLRVLLRQDSQSADAEMPGGCVHLRAEHEAVEVHDARGDHEDA